MASRRCARYEIHSGGVVPATDVIFFPCLFLIALVRSDGVWSTMHVLRGVRDL